MDAYVATRATTRDGKDDYIPRKYSESRKEQELQQRRPRNRMNPAPIEDPTALEVARYLSSLPSGLSVGQAAHLIPSYRKGFAMTGRRTRAANYNAYSDEDVSEEE